jgi:hypothetical protein
MPAVPQFLSQIDVEIEVSVNDGMLPSNTVSSDVRLKLRDLSAWPKHPVDALCPPAPPA